MAIDKSFDDAEEFQEWLDRVTMRMRQLEVR